MCAYGSMVKNSRGRYYVCRKGNCFQSFSCAFLSSGIYVDKTLNGFVCQIMGRKKGTCFSPRRFCLGTIYLSNYLWGVFFRSEAALPDQTICNFIASKSDVSELRKFRRPSDFETLTMWNAQSSNTFLNWEFNVMLIGPTPKRLTNLTASIVLRRKTFQWSIRIY